MEKRSNNLFWFSAAKLSTIADIIVQVFVLINLEVFYQTEVVIIWLRSVMIQIIADTTCGIPVEKLKAQGIYVLPQIIIFGETTYHDDYELDTQTFME